MLKRFIGYYRPHMKLFLVDMLCAVFVAAAGMFYPAIAKNIINDYAPNKNLRMLLYSALLLLLIYLVKALCNYVIGYLGHLLGVRMQKDMRRDLFMKYESLPISYFDDHKTGDLLSRLVGDLFDVSELAHHGPENLFLAVLMLVGSFVILLGINVPLTLIMFAVVPLIVCFSFLSRKTMRSAMKASRAQIALLNANLENAIGGIRETKAYTAAEAEKAKFNRDNEAFAGYRKQAIKSLGSYDAVMKLLSDLLYLVVILVGGIFLYQGAIDAGEFAAFVLYISMFLDPIHRFVALFEQFQEGMSGFGRFHEIMGEAEEPDTGTVELTEVKGELCFTDVSFRYQNSDVADEEKMVIDHLSLHIPAGRTLALVGPSGGGKSTLCNLIPRFYELRQGSITLDGVDIRSIRLESLRKSIGIVSQNVFLFDGTIRENIAYGCPEATEEQVTQAAKRANIHDFITTLATGYDTQVGERGVKLSGGQKQRVAIARMFLKDPKLLILDEATSALDNATEMHIQGALEELSHGRTVIVVAHRLSTVKKADEIVVITADGIAERGTHEELMALGGEYKRLYEYQFRE